MTTEIPEEPDFRLTQQSKDEILDHTPLVFGKFKGKTPSHIAEKEHKGDNYIRWMYETVGNFPTCSAALYKDCGGRGKKAEPARGYGKSSSSYDDERGTAAEDYARKQREQEERSRRPLPNKPASGFDDMDDDIPF